MSLIQMSRIAIFLMSLSLLVFSCRKKDQKFEGSYTGTERYTYTPFGDTAVIDTSFTQTVELTYDNGWYTATRSDTSFGKIAPRFLHKDIKNGPVSKYSESISGNQIWSTYIKISNDSLTISSYETLNGDTKKWEIFTAQ
jgi:major membrane immunogen (membrane-anchored lipoprotein)